MIEGIGSWIEKHSDRHKNKIAIVSDDKRITYAELNSRINSLANKLIQIGIKKGDRINVLLLNTNEILETMFACAKIGAIFVPMNIRLSVKEIHYIVNDSDGKVFIYDEKLIETAEGLKKNNNKIKYFIKVGHLVKSHDINYEEFISDSINQNPNIKTSLEDTHMIMYTSGTTGNPKGVMLTQGNTQWNAINAINALPILENDITLTVAPIFHIGGMNSFTTPTLYKGGTVVLMDKFNPENVLRMIEKEKVTTLFLVAAMWIAITQCPNISQFNLTTLRLNLSGGAPCPITVIEFFQKRKIPFFEGLGATEAAAYITVLDSKYSHNKNGSVGKTLIHSEIKILDSFGNKVLQGDVGELVVKGPNIMEGYWKNPKETKESLKNGWYHTGDLAKIDSEGFIYIVDRKTEMIITGGENVYPIEVVQVLYNHPNVSEVAVVGIPDEKWGESIKAYIVLKNSNTILTLDDIQEFCKDKLARFKIPKSIENIEKLPRNATGKILRDKLVNMSKETGGNQHILQYIEHDT